MQNTSKQILRVGIVGYGNLGKGVQMAISQNPDMELVGIFTRRKPQDLDTKAKVISLDDIALYKGKIDVMILCGGSAKDLPSQVTNINKMFHTVDSFDTHAKIPEYFDMVDQSAKQNGTLSLISTGWDPGLFSMARLIGQSILPQGHDYTFWGEGLSQGHSDAIRRVEGVKDAVQYTIPKQEAIDLVRSGENPQLSTADKHHRVCYVVAQNDANTSLIEKTIVEMPHYFSDYQTTVHFIDQEELNKNHSKMPHGGIVFRSGQTASGNKHRIEFSLALESNPEFTASVLVAFARAVGKLAKQGQTGALSVFDIPLGYLSSQTPQELRKSIL
ncbi:diaminopimelate dehydrogenase [Myroides sp. LJL119]